MNKKIYNTGYTKQYVLYAQMGKIIFLFSYYVGYVVLSLTTGVLVREIYSDQSSTVKHSINSAQRTVTFTDGDGNDVRFVVIDS